MLRRAAGKVCPLIQSHAIDHLVFDASGRDALPVEGFVEGIILGSYDFRPYKTSKESKTELEELSIIVQSEDALADQLQKLSRLLERSILTEEEYAVAKAKLLG